METEMRKLFGAVLGLTITGVRPCFIQQCAGTDCRSCWPLDQTLMPDQTAVVMVDFQNNFASPKGAFLFAV